MATTSFSSVLRHRKYSRRSESTSVFSTNDVMCRALWRHLSSLPYKLSIFVDVGGWQPYSCGEVFTAGWLNATFICPPKNFYTTSSQSVYEITSMFKFWGEGDTQQKFIRGGSTPRSNPLSFYISFWQKTHPLSFPFNWEIDIFREAIWNSNRIRKQKDAQLPNVYHFPENYGADYCGMNLNTFFNTMNTLYSCLKFLFL